MEYKLEKIYDINNLTIDDVDAHKLLKEIGYRIDINEDYNDQQETQEIITETSLNQEDINQNSRKLF